LSTFSLPPGIEVFERGWLSANNIFHFGEDNVSLVDSGYCTHQSMTVDLVRNALDKHGLSTLNQVVNTHLHSDHCGGNAELAKTYDCEIYIPAAEALAVESWDIDLLSYQNLGQECPRFMYDGLLMPGQEIRLGRYLWRALSAPGHAHSVILHQERYGILISADALWEDVNISSHTRPWQTFYGCRQIHSDSEIKTRLFSCRPQKECAPWRQSIVEI
jgi:glyoxylase-like metal-dependent hydrolase (beta-lactamase superfamily II)